MKLSDEERDELLRLKSLDMERFKFHIAQLRRAGWTLASIGDAIDSPRSTIKFWADRAPTNYVTTYTPDPPPTKVKTPRVVKLRPCVPPAYRNDLRALADDAKRVRASTPEASPLRHSARNLDNQIEFLLAQGVTAREIGLYMGVTTRAVKARMERYNESRSK